MRGYGDRTLRRHSLEPHKKARPGAHNTGRATNPQKGITVHSNALVPVQVPGTDKPIMAIEHEGKPVVSLRHACDAIGIEHSPQSRKLKSKSWASVFMMSTQVAGDDQRREYAMIDRRTFTMWLATIDTSRVNQTARPILEAFQAEAADALDAYFNEGGAINPSATTEQLDTLVSKATGQMQLLRAAEGIVDARFLETKARIVIARGLGEAPEIDQQDHPLYVQDYLKSKGLSQSLIEAKQGGFGRRVKGRYMEVHGDAPDQHFQEVHGRPRKINAYTESDRPIFDHVWNTYYEMAVLS